MTPICYHRSMATTLRLPPELKAEADALAARLGISLNALAAVALRDYLDGRSITARSALQSAPPTTRPAALDPRDRAKPEVRAGVGAPRSAWRHSGRVTGG